MLKPVKGSSETLQHFCKGRKKPAIDIFIHDVTAYILEWENEKPKLINIKHCPFCGVIIDNDRED